MATSKVSVTEGTGKNMGTNSITEDAVTKELQRVVPNTSAGVEISPLTDTQLRATPVPVSGTVAMTNAGITSMDSKMPALGQALAAGSTPVVLTAAQIATLTPPAAITGFAIETGGNLASIKTNTDKIPSLGQALAASSVPVVLTAAQIATLTPVSAVTATLAAETTKVIGTVNDKAADGDLVTLGAKADAKSTATDTTPASVVAVLKEISYMEQNPASRAVTNAGTFPVQNTPPTGNGKTKKWVTGSAASAGSNTIIAAVNGKKITVNAYSLILATTGTSPLTVTFKDGTNGTSMWTTPLQALTGAVCGSNLSVSAPDFLFQGASNTLVDLYLSAAQAVIYNVSYWEE